MKSENRVEGVPLKACVLWSGERRFGILRRGEVQGYILRLGNGTGGHE